MEVLNTVHLTPLTPFFEPGLNEVPFKGPLMHVFNRYAKCALHEEVVRKDLSKKVIFEKRPEARSPGGADP